MIRLKQIILFFKYYSVFLTIFWGSSAFFRHKYGKKRCINLNNLKTINIKINEKFVIIILILIYKTKVILLNFNFSKLFF